MGGSEEWMDEKLGTELCSGNREITDFRQPRVLDKDDFCLAFWRRVGCTASPFDIFQPDIVG